MTEENNIGEIAAALARARSNFRPLKKSHTADLGNFSYSYADLADLDEATRDALCAEELVPVEAPQVTEGGTLVLKASILHSSGQSISAALPLPWDTDQRPQDLGTALTYYRRYLRQGLLGLAAEADTDAHVAAPAPRPAPPAPRQAEAAPAAAPTRAPAGGPTISPSEAGKLMARAFDRVKGTEQEGSPWPILDAMLDSLGAEPHEGGPWKGHLTTVVQASQMDAALAFVTSSPGAPPPPAVPGPGIPSFEEQVDKEQAAMTQQEKEILGHEAADLEDLPF